jgi:hypothetical protein
MKLNLFNSLTRLPLITGVAALSLLALMIGTSSTKLVYDEPYHLELAKNVLATGWHAALTSPDNMSAAGPLYAAIQIAASPLTGFRAPEIRWVNFVCLVFVIFTLAKTSQMEFGHPNWIPAITMLSVPFLWPTSGMALTELPALAAFTFFICSLLKVLCTPDDKISVRSFAWAAVAGLSLGFSILGRQTYLVIMPAVFALFFVAPKKWALWLTCVALAISSSAWLFVLWHGLEPPSLQNQDSGFRLDFGVLSLSYVATATLFINPSWLKIKSIKSAVVFFLITAFLVLLTSDYSTPPSKPLLLKVFGIHWGLLVGFCVGSFMTALAVVWLCNTLLMAWRGRHNPVSVFLFLILFSLVAAPIKIPHLFSSRYVVGLLGVLVLVVGAPQRSSYWLTFRIVLGSLAGAVTLWKYFH